MYSAIFLLFVATWQSGFCQEAVAAEISDQKILPYPYPGWPVCKGINYTISCGPIYESNCQSNKQTFMPCDVCICSEGYFRDPATGNCVLPQDCSNPSEQCPPDAVMVHPCITRKCSPYAKPCMLQCVPLCECPEGYFWSNCGCRSLKPDVPFNPVTLGPIISGPIFAEGQVAQAEIAGRSHHHKKHHAKSHKKHHN